MKILHTVESYLPEKNGMSEVVRQISENLVLLGHDITVATSYNSLRNNVSEISGVKIVEFKLSGNSVEGILGDPKDYIHFLINSEFDICVNFAAQQWATDLFLSVIDQIDAIKIIVPTGFSKLYDPSYVNYFEEMRRSLPKYNSVVLTSRHYQDYDFINSISDVSITIIPNGASLAEFSKNSSFSIHSHLRIPIDSKILLHVGSFTGIKGHIQAIRIYLEAKLNSDVHLLFIGGNLNPKDAKPLYLLTSWFKYASFWDYFSLGNLKLLITHLIFRFKGRLINREFIHFLKLSREDTVSTFNSADLLLFPSMLECSPVVIFESMASKTPFLSNNVGNVQEIINISNGGIILPSRVDKNGFVRSNIKKSALILSSLINANTIDLASMGNAGYKYWRKNYTWEDISKRYLHLFEKLINE